MAHTITLPEGAQIEDVYILTPREKGTIIAALRLMQKINTPSGRRFYCNGDFDWEVLDAIATDGGAHEALDEGEIDFVIDGKLNI